MNGLHGRLILLLTATALAFLIAEVVTRGVLVPYLGWQFESPLPERIEQAREAADGHHRVIGVFGDSIVEYYRDTDVNLVAVANRQDDDGGGRFVNFGFSGTDIPDYLAKFEYVAQASVLNEAIFVIFTGNDYYDYFFRLRSGQTLSLPARERGLIQLEYTGSRLMNGLKHSVFLHALWRYGVKGWLGLFLGEDIRSLALAGGRRVGIPAATIERNLKAVDPQLAQAADRDQINKYQVAMSVVDPLMYQRIRYDFGDAESAVSDALRRDAGELANLCQRNRIACGVLFVDSPVFVDPEYHAFYRGMGCQLDDHILGEPHHTTLLKELFATLGIPTLDTREYLAGRHAYLHNDEHPNPHGHALLGALLPRLDRRMHASD